MAAKGLARGWLSVHVWVCECLRVGIKTPERVNKYTHVCSILHIYTVYYERVYSTPLVYWDHISRAGNPWQGHPGGWFYKNCLHRFEKGKKNAKQTAE